LKKGITWTLLLSEGPSWEKSPRAGLSSCSCVTAMCVQWAANWPKLWTSLRGPFPRVPPKLRDNLLSCMPLPRHGSHSPWSKHASGRINSKGGRRFHLRREGAQGTRLAIFGPARPVRAKIQWTSGAVAGEGGFA